MKNLTILLQKQFDKMTATGILFKSSITGAELWKIYLEGFGDDAIFRDPESSEHNCNHCNNFIKRYGNIVSVDKDNNIMSIFDIEIEAVSEYHNSVILLSKLLRGAKIKSTFTETFNSLKSLPYEQCTKSNEQFALGTAKNVKRYTQEEADLYGVVKKGQIITFNHFHLSLPTAFVDKQGRSIESINAGHNASYAVFKRGISEIPLDTLKLVRDLIMQKSLLNGDSYLSKLETFIKLSTEYSNLVNKEAIQDNWFWKASHKLPIAKFRNELIGVLCTELAEGVDINKACSTWNKRVDPINYMKAVAPITEMQKKNAQEFVEENGYESAFNRRFATLEDIKASEIKHINNSGETLQNTSVSIFDKVKAPKKSTRHKKSQFATVGTVPIDTFMNSILPECTDVEVYVENRHENNFVSLTTTVDKESKQIFKWDNPYSWTYKGNLAGKSMIKEAVKSQGGKVDGVLRFSIMWSNGKSIDNSDLDAHCIEPSKRVIMYSSPTSYTKGNLDIDIVDPRDHKGSTGKEVVENITYPDLSSMPDGNYSFLVDQYSERNSEGFTAEIEFNGEIHEYNYPKRVRGTILVATVTLKKGKFSIKHSIDSTSSNKDIYNIETNSFHKVNLMCLSPNYWDSNIKKEGNKHFFFMLDKCIADSSIRSFHNENLLGSLAEHRKVLDVLGAVNTLESKASPKQLSGVGFNSTVRDDVILRLSGSFKRLVRVTF